MVKKRVSTNVPTEGVSRVSRRDFFAQGAAAGVGAVALAGTGGAAQAHAFDQARGFDANSIQWDYEADVIVCGSGATALPAAKRAHDLGADVLVIEQNYDVGGKLAHNGGRSSLGGGDPIQERDRLGLADPDGWLTEPLMKPEDLTDDPDTLFRDTTDWSVVSDVGIPDYRYNPRDFQRGWADNAAATRQFLMDNHVRFSRIDGTHQLGGMTKARAAYAIMKLGDKTDIEAGTITTEDAGDWNEERQSPFNPQTCYGAGSPADAYGAPGCVRGGFVIARSLEWASRKAGVRFMVNRHLDEIIREGGNSGRIIGVKASYTPRFSPKTGERLESTWSNGNIDERKEVIYIRARKAVIVGTGGWQGNVHFRTGFDPRKSEPSMQWGSSWMGPRHGDASGILAGMKVGAGLGGLFLGYQHVNAGLRLYSNLAAGDNNDTMMPGHPAFEFMGSAGIPIGAGGWEYFIAVNQVGQRFYNEISTGNERGGTAQFPPGTAGTNNPFTALDWRNASVDHVRASFNQGGGTDAALAINEGSRAPDYSSGPVWAIFDQAAVDANDWPIRYPFIADPPNGLFFKADTIAELAHLVLGSKFQHMPLKYLEETVARFNAFVDAGKDEDFEKPTMHKIDKAPFYAASIPLSSGDDSYGGLRIDGQARVIDIFGNPIPGLYAGGEASGGGRQHGIGRACITGFIAGTNAAA